MIVGVAVKVASHRMTSTLQSQIVARTLNQVHIGRERSGDSLRIEAAQLKVSSNICVFEWRRKHSKPVSGFVENDGTGQLAHLYSDLLCFHEFVHLLNIRHFLRVRAERGNIMIQLLLIRIGAGHLLELLL